MNRKKRTKQDWNKHEITEVITLEVKIWTFAIPETKAYAVKFINCEGTLTVTGDFGNYVFCREFHPSAEGWVSDGYWLEKLRMKSCQSPEVYDVPATIEAISEFKQQLIDDYAGEESIPDMYTNYIERCELYVDGPEYEYDAAMYGDMPDDMDYEDVPKGYKIVNYLEQVFDAFDEMCRRYKEQEKVKS